MPTRFRVDGDHTAGIYDRGRPEAEAYVTNEAYSGDVSEVNPRVKWIRLARLLGMRFR
jgi:hypothetical protein